MIVFMTFAGGVQLRGRQTEASVPLLQAQCPSLRKCYIGQIQGRLAYPIGPIGLLPIEFIDLLRPSGFNCFRRLALPGPHQP